MKEKIKEFLDHSNRIEGEWGKQVNDDSLKAWNYLLKEDNLTLDKILETHNLLMKNLYPEISGELRDCGVRVGPRICPDWNTIPDLMTRWLKNYSKASTKEEIKEAHIQFELMHPFVDGNGRVGRIIMNWQRVKNNLPILIIHEGYEQKEYYKWFRED